jgi:hypothetical protein
LTRTATRTADEWGAVHSCAAIVAAIVDRESLGRTGKKGKAAGDQARAKARSRS